MTLPTRPYAIFSSLQGAQPAYPGRRISSIICSTIHQAIFIQHQTPPNTQQPDYLSPLSRALANSINGQKTLFTACALRLKWLCFNKLID